MSDNPILSVTLKNEFNNQQCLDAATRIQAIKGVISVTPSEGCFGGEDNSQLHVTYDPQYDVSAAVLTLPEVKWVRPGLQFGPS